MYYNLAKTAELLGMTTADVNRLREQGKLRAFKDGADWKFRKEEVDKYLTNLVKERSGQNADSGLLSSDDDEDKTTLAQDSAAFETMFDQAGDELEITAKKDEKDQDDGLSFDEDEGLSIADDDDFSLDDNLDLAVDAPAPKKSAELTSGNDSPLTSEDSALAEDLGSVDLTSGSGSGDDLNLSNSDSGLSLLDDVGGSNVDLAGDDLVLGGSGSGSGSGLNLASDSGLSLASDSDGAFELDAAVSEQQQDLELAPEEDSKKQEEDDSLFQLAPEASEKTDAAAQVLNLDQSADTEAPTELAADESVFELSTETTNAPQSSESLSSSVLNATTDQSVEAESNPFVTDDDDEEDDGGVFGLAGENDATPAPPEESASESKSIDVLDEGSDMTSDPFLTEDSEETPFAGATTTESPFDSGSDAGSGDAFGGSDSFASSSDSFGEGSSGFGESSGSGDVPSFSETSSAPTATPVSSTQFTGKDLIFLVPCLIFLILAAVGALELCRTIWSYQEGTFDLSGPLLESIAKMVKLI